MTYFKVIQDNKIISIGCVFVKWDEERRRFFICGVDEGQFVQSYDEQHYYHDSWLKPSNAPKQEEASIIVIGQQEYIELLEIFDQGETVEIKAPVVEYEPEVEPKQEDKPMSIAEMRETIARQQEQIDMLINKLNRS